MDFDENNLYHPKNIDLYNMMYMGKGDIDYLADRLVSKHEGAVLELACGMGRVLLDLVRRFPKRDFAGLDYHNVYLDACLQRARGDDALNAALRSGRLQLIEGDMSDLHACLPPEKMYSVIVLCNSSFLHLETAPRRIGLLNGVKKRLEQGGVLLLEYSLDFWRSWDWKEKAVPGSPYRIRRRNILSENGLYSTRSFEFTNPKTGEIRTVSVTPWLFDQQWLSNSLRETGLTILTEENAFPNEVGMRRRILHIGHSVCA